MYYFWIFLLWVAVIAIGYAVICILRNTKDTSGLYKRISRLEESVIDCTELEDTIEDLQEDVVALVKRMNQMSNIYNKAIMEAKYNESVAGSNSVHEEE